MTLPKQDIKQTKSLTYSTAKHYHLSITVYQPITSKCQPNLRRIDILCQYALKKMVEIKCKIGVAHFSPDFIGIQIALNPR